MLSFNRDTLSEYRSGREYISAPNLKQHSSQISCSVSGASCKFRSPLGELIAQTSGGSSE
jgi:hypothetical protein